MADEANTPILLNVSDAAKLLSVSEKTLWNHTAPRGNCIPAVPFGRTVRYSRAALEEWIALRYGPWLAAQQNAEPLAGGGG